MTIAASMLQQSDVAIAWGEDQTDHPLIKVNGVFAEVPYWLRKTVIGVYSHAQNDRSIVGYRSRIERMIPEVLDYPFVERWVVIQRLISREAGILSMARFLFRDVERFETSLSHLVIELKLWNDGVGGPSSLRAAISDLERTSPLTLKPLFKNSDGIVPMFHSLSVYLAGLAADRIGVGEDFERTVWLEIAQEVEWAMKAGRMTDSDRRRLRKVIGG